jgi:hypothetical protein
MPYATVPPNAWSGWRLTIPGGPEGGQYHGFIAPDSLHSWPGGEGGWPPGGSEIGPAQHRPSGISQLPQGGSSKGPWDKNWGGTKFDELQTHSDYIYRGPGETRPNPNASGGANVVRGEQRERTPGYAEAPGNYKALGGLGIPAAGEAITIVPNRQISFRPPNYACPTWGCGAPPIISPGPTALTPQPPPPDTPAPVNTVYVYGPPPTSPAPAPTVAASPADYMPSQGQPLPTTSVASFDLGSWLDSETIWSGVQNYWIVGGAAFALFAFMGRGKR